MSLRTRTAHQRAQKRKRRRDAPEPGRRYRDSRVSFPTNEGAEPVQDVAVGRAEPAADPGPEIEPQGEMARISRALGRHAENSSPSTDEVVAWIEEDRAQQRDALAQDERERLESTIVQLRTELRAHEDATNRWQAPPGFTIATVKVGGGETEGKNVHANVFHFVATHEKSGWMSQKHIDKQTAIRSAWDRYAEMQVADVEAERDELQRRWDQRKKTEASRARAASQDGG